MSRNVEYDFHPFSDVLRIGAACYRDPADPLHRVTISPSAEYPGHWYAERSTGGYIETLKLPIRSDGLAYMLESWKVLSAIEYWSPADADLVPPTRPQQSRRHHVVYFVQAGPFIKIGFTSRDIEYRIAQMRTGCPFPIQVLGAIDGDQRTERALHARFAAHRHHGEWFRCDPEILAFVREHADAA